MTEPDDTALAAELGPVDSETVVVDRPPPETVYSWQDETLESGPVFEADGPHTPGAYPMARAHRQPGLHRGRRSHGDGSGGRCRAHSRTDANARGPHGGRPGAGGPAASRHHHRTHPISPPAPSHRAGYGCRIRHREQGGRDRCAKNLHTAAASTATSGAPSARAPSSSLSKPRWRWAMRSTPIARNSATGARPRRTGWSRVLVRWC